MFYLLTCLGFCTLTSVNNEVQVDVLVEQIRLLKQQVKALQEQLDWFHRQLYGAKAERFIASDTNDTTGEFIQLSFFGTVLPEEAPNDSQASGEQIAIPAHKRNTRKSNPGRHPFPDNLERRFEVIDPPGIERRIDADGNTSYPGYTIIRSETSERIVYQEAKVFVLVTKRPVLSKLSDKSVYVAEMPDRVLAKSQADESLAVEVIIRKLLDHQPVYRQVAAWERDFGWVVSRATVGTWVEQVATVLRPLYNALRTEVLSSDYIQMDESGILVLAASTVNPEHEESNAPKPKSQKLNKIGSNNLRRHQGWMWLARDPVRGLVLFEYDRTRSHSLPLDLLEHYKGYLQIDGYSAYRTALRKLDRNASRWANAIIIVCCIVHIRRKFFDALSSYPEACRQALEMIQAMYAEEAKCRHYLPDERLAYRRVHLAPLFEEFEKWLESYRHQVIPKGKFAIAINYALKHWPETKAMLEDGRIELDNNSIENIIRLLALGRKNYLFAGNHGAAKNLAVLYSLLGTCKALGVNPRVYLTDVLSKIVSHPINRISELLPSAYVMAEPKEQTT